MSNEFISHIFLNIVIYQLVISMSQEACLVSGGVDSMVLLDLLGRSRCRSKSSLCVLHFNHGLRGRESDRDAQFVEHEVRKKGFDCQVISLPVVTGTGIQNRARQARHAALRDLAMKLGLTHVYLAHHLDDQIETMIMRLMRGTGLAGLAGMKGVTRLQKNGTGLTLVRPFLNWTKEQIQGYARQHRIAFVEDSSNGGATYLRNRLRHFLIPALKQQIPDFYEVMRKAHQEVVRCHAAVLAQAAGLGNTGDLPIFEYLKHRKSVRYQIMAERVSVHGGDAKLGGRAFLDMEELCRRGKNLRKKFGCVELVISSGSFTLKAD